MKCDWPRMKFTSSGFSIFTREVFMAIRWKNTYLNIMNGRG
jgi:hypothetical protein